MHKNLIDMSGKTIGRWRVISLYGRTERRTILWNCQCICGNKSVIQAGALRNGTSLSCGCFRRERQSLAAIKHGQYGTRLYMIYIGAKGRCTNPKNKAYPNYGGRGIIFKFKNFEDFFDVVNPLQEEAVKKYGKQRISLDRIDDNGHYEAGNLRFVNFKEQGRNQRTNHLIKYRGEEKCLSQWAEDLLINKTTLSWRLSNGWTIEEAFT